MTYRPNSCTNTNNSLCQCTSPCPKFSSPHQSCEVYPADCCAQKCVETHPWRRHFPVCLRHLIPQTHTRAARMWVPGGVQLSACISVNTCTRLHILHGFRTVPTYCQSTSCTLKVSQQCCVTMVIAPPWSKPPQNVNEPAGKLSASPSPPSVCYYNTHSSQNRIISAVASLLLLSLALSLSTSKVETPEHTDLSFTMYDL